ncbi:DUF445 family protein [Candidatus Bipolaricaulota bacterium]|nr:DUF445 family protein [Candidatus Bipolaricaulota bacterium]
MDFNYYFVLLPLVAGVIGYSTNWIAIRMLFRPLKEKRFFGCRVPFTPGLIPRRRDEIAENIGQAVGAHLLTPSALKQRLDSPGVKKRLEDALESWVMYFFQSELGSVMEIVPDKARPKLEKGFNVLADKMEGWLNDMLTGDSMEFFLRQMIRKGFNVLSQKEVGELVEHWSYREISLKLGSIISEFTDKEDTEELIEEFWIKKLDEISKKGGKLEDYLGEEIKQLLIGQVEANLPLLMKKGAELLDNPELRKRFKNLVLDSLDETFQREFNEDSVWDQVKRGFLETLILPEERLNEKVEEMIDRGVPRLIELAEREQVRQEVAASGVESVRKFLEKDLSEILSSDRVTKKSAKILTDISVATIQSEKVQSFILEVLMEVLKNSEGKKLDEFVELEPSEEKEALIRSISDYVIEILGSKEVQAELHRVLKKKLEGLSEKKIGKLSRWVDPGLITPFSGLVVEEIIGIVSRQGSEIMNALDVQEMVREEVDRFSTGEVERLVLEVTGDQFRAITWFGALIGFVIGIIQVLILVVGG